MLSSPTKNRDTSCLSNLSFCRKQLSEYQKHKKEERSSHNLLLYRLRKFVQSEIYFDILLRKIVFKVAWRKNCIDKLRNLIEIATIQYWCAVSKTTNRVNYVAGTTFELSWSVTGKYHSALWLVRALERIGFQYFPLSEFRDCGIKL